MILGLTGSYCAGKNYIAKILEARGLPVLDVDKQGHQVIEAEKRAIAARFGNQILSADGKIDRKLLGALVFGKPGELAALEAIVHPAVNRLSGEWIKARNGAPCVINAALLHRSSAFAGLNGILLVKAPLISRFLRALKRDRLGPWALIRRFGSQKDFSSQYFKEKTDIYIIENPGFFSFGSRQRQKKLENRVDEILALLGYRKV
jgi:dephospho-CoA kinase